MKIAEKKTKIEALESLIFKKKQLKETNTKGLEILKLEYERLNQSLIPILLFVYQDDVNSKFNYIYYCPDLDLVKLESGDDENSLLTNALDLREKFDELVISKEDLRIDSKIIQLAVGNIKSIINDAINYKYIKTWNEAREFLGMVPRYYFTCYLEEYISEDVVLKRTYD